MNQDETRAIEMPENRENPAAAAARGGVLAFERWLVRRLLHALHDPPIRVTMWNGEEITTSTQPSTVKVVFRDRGCLYKLVFNADLNFGDLYSEDRIRVEGSMVTLTEVVSRSTSVGGTLKDHAPRWFDQIKANTLRRAKANIYHHYDIGNEFYKLWLDEKMVYTCAYFPTPDATLEEAQFAKMEHVCRKLRLKPGDSVAEAGCGWGSLALHMAKHHGVKVKAYNISHQQILFARERAKVAGLEGQVEFIEDDYRNIAGKFDAFVSVGMLEHVGPKNYRTLGGVIDRVLAPHGRGLIHSIGRNRPVRMNQWIAARIFPGGYTPSLGEMSEIFEPYALSITDVENLRLHYARTLHHWLERFEAHRDEVRKMFDDKFIRMWRLYLAGSMAAFTTGWMQLFQVAFTRAENNEVPMTREYLYGAK